MPECNQAHEKIISNKINPDCCVSIVIPIRNEAENIVGTLNRLNAQVDLKGAPLDRNLYEIIVLANNCHDDSALVVESYARARPDLKIHQACANLPPEKANIGYVRRWMMEEAYLRLRGNKSGRGVILSTDGDTCVAANWIAANLHEIEKGADAVGGRITIKKSDLLEMNDKARRFHLLDTGYRLLAAEAEARLDFVAHDYLPRHHQHFNGSFAVTTDAFRRAGGIPAVSFLEDVAFFQALMRIDAKFRHSPLVRVETSSRTAGRTEMGLSTQINEWLEMGRNGDTYYVESAQAVIERIKSRNLLRKFWGEKKFSTAETKQLAGKLMIGQNFLEKELQKEQSFGALLEKVQRAQYETGAWQTAYPLVCVSRAISDLRENLEILRRGDSKKANYFTQTSSR